MKKIFILSFSLLLIIFGLSNFKSITHNNGQFIYMALDEEPQLPEEAFPYSDIQLPEHFLNDSIDGFGYDVGEVDSTRFDFIDNDIATLGRVLFYDKKLSALENISCASCHEQKFSFADDKVLSEGVNTLTKRNSMALNDIGWTDNHSFFWDMSETDLREMIVLPLKDENEIGADIDEVVIKLQATSYYPDLFVKAFGTNNINEIMIVEALAHFMSSMTTFNSKFDEASNNGFNNFSDEEMLGLLLFDFQCGFCHIQGDLSEMFGIFPEDEIHMAEFFPEMFTNGLPILPGEDDNGAGEWLDGFDRLYKVPTLRNIELTGPYMHDGRFETLEEVVKYYSEDVGINDHQWFIPEGGYGFTDDEQQALVAFLKTLTDQSFIEDEKFSNPFGITSIKNTNEPILNLVVKPNPMADYSTIEFDAEPNTQTQLRITNGQGQEVLTDIINGNSYQLNKGNFGGGVYFLYFRQGNKTSTHKLIVQ